MSVLHRVLALPKALNERERVSIRNVETRIEAPFDHIITDVQAR